MTLALPDTLVRALLPSEHAWSAKGYQVFLSQGSWSGQGSWGGLPLVSDLNPDKPWGRLDNASFDLSKREIKLAVDVVPTLGVTRTTYNALAFAGTFFSAALGSGWVWQLFTWLRTRKPESPIVVNGH